MDSKPIRKLWKKIDKQAKILNKTKSTPEKKQKALATINEYRKKLQSLESSYFGSL